MILRKKNLARTAAWIAFGLVALAAVQSTADDPAAVSESKVLDPEGDAPKIVSPLPPEVNDGATTTASQQDHDQAEAARAFKQALFTLSTLTAHAPSHTHDPSYGSYSVTPTSIISSLAQNQGPLGSAIRIIIKLQQQSWLPRFMSAYGKEGLGLGLGGGSRKKEEELRGKAIKVIDLLQHSAELGHSDALYTLAQISLFPPNAYFPSDPHLAFDALNAHADITGNATSQSLLAFFYATGYHGIVPINQAKAQLYYTFAAHGGDKGAQTALGYRFWAGISTVEDCGRALEWYERASEQAMVKFLSGPPGGRSLPQTPTRLSDLEGGVYGPGASVASTGLNAHRPAVKAGLARAAGETWEDVLEYYLFNADRGETDFAYRLGKIFYQGSIYAAAGGIASGSEGVGAVPRDLPRARHYFLRIARQVWPRDPPYPSQYTPPAIKDDNHGPVGHAAASAAYLGRMYLRGEGVKADPVMAKVWFDRGAEYGDRECHNGLGIIWRDSLVHGKADLKLALTHFSIAAGQELAEAQVNLGKYHYQRGELKLATTYFETAIRHGSPFEAYYYLAEIQASQTRLHSVPQEMVNGFCGIAVSFHKLVAERGVWDDDLLRDAEIAWLSGTDRGKEISMLKWWIAAERGSEIAQNNLAHILDQDRSILRLTRFSPMTPSNDTAKLALTQWTRSAHQHNVDALVKVGDYYYHGLGVLEDSETTRLEKAARYYQSAADTQLSALAMWNLGWMYENGVGVPQDFHLAKRHYDMALATNTEAYLPVLLSLGKLYLRSVWHTLMGGKGGLNLWNLDGEETGSQRSQDRQLEGSKADDVTEGPPGGADGGMMEEEDGPWYMGKARDEFRRRRQGINGGRPQAEEEDPIQWARERRNAEQDRDNDFGPEDYFDGAMRGGHRGEENAVEFRETLLLLTLCLLVSVLLYVRTRLHRLYRDLAEVLPQPEGDANGPPQPAQPDLGVFPQAEDAARDEWAILR